MNCPRLWSAQAATRAGAHFAVSPGYTPTLGQTCRDAGLALLPGVATGGEVMQAQEDGFTEIKFFTAMPKARSDPFFDVKFCPTGGVTLQNAPEFFALPNVVCVGGSWPAPAEPHAGGNWARITPLAAEARALARITSPKVSFRALLGVGLSTAPTLKFPQRVNRISGSNLVRYIKSVL